MPTTMGLKITFLALGTSPIFASLAQRYPHVQETLTLDNIQYLESLYDDDYGFYLCIEVELSKGQKIRVPVRLYPKNPKAVVQGKEQKSITSKQFQWCWDYNLVYLARCLISSLARCCPVALEQQLEEVCQVIDATLAEVIQGTYETSEAFRKGLVKNLDDQLPISREVAENIAQPVVKYYEKIFVQGDDPSKKDKKEQKPTKAKKNKVVSQKETTQESTSDVKKKKSTTKQKDKSTSCSKSR